MIVVEGVQKFFYLILRILAGAFGRQSFFRLSVEPVVEQRIADAHPCIGNRDCLRGGVLKDRVDDFIHQQTVSIGIVSVDKSSATLIRKINADTAVIFVLIIAGFPEIRIEPFIILQKDMGDTFQLSGKPPGINRICIVKGFRNVYDGKMIVPGPVDHVDEYSHILFSNDNRLLQNRKSVVGLEKPAFNQPGQKERRREHRILHQRILCIAAVELNRDLHFIKIHDVVRVPDSAVGSLLFVSDRDDIFVLVFLDLKPQSVAAETNVPFPVPVHFRYDVFRERIGLIAFNDQADKGFYRQRIVDIKNCGI